MFCYYCISRLYMEHQLFVTLPWKCHFTFMSLRMSASKVSISGVTAIYINLCSFGTYSLCSAIIRQLRRCYWGKMFVLSELKAFLAVFFARSIAQVSRSVNTQGLRVRIPPHRRLNFLFVLFSYF